MHASLSLTRLARSRILLSATWAIALLTAAAAIALFIVAIASPELWDELHRKDSYDGAGLVENLTVLLLVPAVPLALFAVWKWGSRLPWWPLRIWVILWALAAIYLGGEEISWGQWHFQWQTPQAFAANNDQGETNLHNITPWLDQKPRALVELFIIVAGLVVPSIARLRSGRPLDDDAPGAWILAHPICFAPAAAFFLSRMIEFIIPGQLGQRLDESELRELAISWFIAVYLISYFLRLRARAR
jgi:hypothetical protein